MSHTRIHTLTHTEPKKTAEVKIKRKNNAKTKGKNSRGLVDTHKGKYIFSVQSVIVFVAVQITTKGVSNESTAEFSFVKFSLFRSYNV